MKKLQLEVVSICSFCFIFGGLDVTSIQHETRYPEPVTRLNGANNIIFIVPKGDTPRSVTDSPGIVTLYASLTC